MHAEIKEPGKKKIHHIQSTVDFVMISTNFALHRFLEINSSAQEGKMHDHDVTNEYSIPQTTFTHSTFHTEEFQLQNGNANMRNE